MPLLDYYSSHNKTVDERNHLPIHDLLRLNSLVNMLWAVVLTHAAVHAASPAHSIRVRAPFTIYVPPCPGVLGTQPVIVRDERTALPQIVLCQKASVHAASFVTDTLALPGSILTITSSVPYFYSRLDPATYPPSSGIELLPTFISGGAGGLAALRAFVGFKSKDQRKSVGSIVVIAANVTVVGAPIEGKVLRGKGPGPKRYPRALSHSSLFFSKTLSLSLTRTLSLSHTHTHTHTSRRVRPRDHWSSLRRRRIPQWSG